MIKLCNCGGCYSTTQNELFAGTPCRCARPICAHCAEYEQDCKCGIFSSVTVYSPPCTNCEQIKKEYRAELLKYITAVAHAKGALEGIQMQVDNALKQRIQTVLDTVEQVLK